MLAEEAERIYMEWYLTASGHKEEYCKDEGVLLLVNLITEFQNKSNIVSKILFWGGWEIGVGVFWHPELQPLSYCIRLLHEALKRFMLYILLHSIAKPSHCVFEL